MKRFFKIFTFLVFTFSMISIVCLSQKKNVKAASENFLVKADLLGFTIIGDFEPVHMDETFQSDDDSNIDGYFEVYQILLKHKIYDYYAFLYKLTTTPTSNTANGSVHTVIQLPTTAQILDYAPKNNPSQYQGSMGIGLDGSGISVSASIDWQLSDLEVVSKTNHQTKTYETDYNYAWMYFFPNSYLKGSLNHYGMVIFQSSGTFTISLSHRVSFARPNPLPAYGQLYQEYSYQSHYHRFNYQALNIDKHEGKCIKCNYTELSRHLYRFEQSTQLYTCKICKFSTPFIQVTGV